MPVEGYNLREPASIYSCHVYGRINQTDGRHYRSNKVLDHFNSEILQLKEPNKKISASFDVFLKTLEFSPTATAMRFRKIEDTCEEIGLWWDRV